VTIAVPPLKRNGLIERVVSEQGTRAVVIEKPLGLALADVRGMAADMERAGILEDE
jgi:hypothetical protein